MNNRSRKSHLTPALSDKRNERDALEADLFKGLEPDEVARFFELAQKKMFPPGSIIYTPEDPSTERLFVLKKGRVERYRLTRAGKRLVTRRILPGDVFGVMGLLGRTMQKNFAEAIEESEVYVFTREQVLTLLKRKPEFALRVLENVGQRVVRLEERLVEAAYSPVSVRVAGFLLDNAEPASGLIRGITHEQLADAIGAVRQTVTENLAVMRRRGLLQTGMGRIWIRNRRELEKEAGR